MTARRLSASARIARELDRWFLVEPLLYAVWATHRLVLAPTVETARVGGGRVEINPDFVNRLDDRSLSLVLQGEALRIVLGHPYLRKKPHAARAWRASSIAIAECLRAPPPFLRARSVFGEGAEDDQTFERYYTLLDAETAAHPLAADAGADGATHDGTDDSTAALRAYVAPRDGGRDATRDWDQDDLLLEQLRAEVSNIEASRSWGTLAGRLRERILAAQQPRVHFTEILRAFRTSIVSRTRYLTRMRPSRRYGFGAMGSRYALRSRLLVAIDVSGSMSTRALSVGLAAINRLFAHAVEQIDVIQFDTAVRGEALSMTRARHEIHCLGRGGTSFQPVIAYLDAHPAYDGVIVYTDGEAPTPTAPLRSRARLAWLFTNARAWSAQRAALSTLGLTAFLEA